MIVASALLSNSVIKLRKEFLEQTNHLKENGHREIRLAVTSITLNIIFISLTLPLPVVLLFVKNIRSEFFIIFRNICYKKPSDDLDFELE